MRYKTRRVEVREIDKVALCTEGSIENATYGISIMLHGGYYESVGGVCNYSQH